MQHHYQTYASLFTTRVPVKCTGMARSAEAGLGHAKYTRLCYFGMRLNALVETTEVSVAHIELQHDTNQCCQALSLIQQAPNTFIILQFSRRKCLITNIILFQNIREGLNCVCKGFKNNQFHFIDKHLLRFILFAICSEQLNNKITL